MVDFTRKRTHVSDSPKLVVDAGLPLGAHVIELVITNAEGEKSPPKRIRFEIVRAGRVRPSRRAKPRRRRSEP